MTTFHDLTAAQLRHVIHLKERIEYLQGLLARLRGTATKKKVGTRTASPGTRAKVVTGQKVHQAKKKGSVASKSRVQVAATMKARRSAKKKGVHASRTTE